MKIDRMNIGSWGKIRAYFDLTIETDLGGLVVKGLQIVEGISGLFVSMPQEKKGDEYYDRVIPLTKELREKINHLALSKYHDSGAGSEPVLEMVEKDNKKAVVEGEDVPF